VHFLQWCYESESAARTGFSRRTLAVIRPDTVVASSAVEAESLGAVIDVDFAVLAGPTVHADAQIVALLVVTSRSILTRVCLR